MKLFMDNIDKAQRPSSSCENQQAPSTLHTNVNKPYKFTYSRPNLEVHNGELTSLRGMGDSTDGLLNKIGLNCRDLSMDTG